MKNLEQLGLKVLQSLDPERAHNLAIKALQMGLVPKPRSRSFPRLNSQLAGLTLPNPIGLAAGFDKNAQALNGLAACGFGFLEIGAATPVAQPSRNRRGHPGGATRQPQAPIVSLAQRSRRD